jgi:hypothetical protein
VNSSSIWLGDAWMPFAMIGRIGSTRPIPMNATMHAPSTAQTAFGWSRRPGRRGVLLIGTELSAGTSLQIAAAFCPLCGGCHEGVAVRIYRRAYGFASSAISPFAGAPSPVIESNPGAALIAVFCLVQLPVPLQNTSLPS